MSRVLLFGGTTEARRIAKLLCDGNVTVHLCVATSYGRDILEPNPRLTICEGRLGTSGMVALIREIEPELVIDATHPYARDVTVNLEQACAETGVERWRVLRREGDSHSGRIAASCEEAADILSREGGTALLTVGSKELEYFTRVPGYQQRLYARVLPDRQVLDRCIEMGFTGNHLIAMQGPFSRELNAAMLRQTGASWLVTKDSGDEGGFAAKVDAAEETGARLLVISRPVQEKGMTLDEAIAAVTARFSIPAPSSTEEEKPYFPLFVNLHSRKVVIIGGGNIALRRATVLLEFGAEILVVSPRLEPGLQEMEQQKKIDWRQGTYHSEDLNGTVLAIAATDSRKVNRQVGIDAKERGIPVSVADCREECTAIFPAIATKGELIAGITSSNGDHRAVAKSAALFRKGLEQLD